MNTLRNVVKEKVLKGSGRIIIDNTVALMLLQIANFLLPLVNLPYLMSVLGPKNFGTVTFALSFVAFLQILTDYGFNLSATREMAIAQSDREVNVLFSSVVLCKSLLGFLLIILGVLVINLIPSVFEDQLVYYICITNVFSNIFISTWLFQGKQQMKYITLVSLVSKSVMTILIFIMVKKGSDYYLYAAISVLSSLIIGFLGQLISIFKLRVKYVKVSFEDLCHQYKNGWPLFVSTLMSSLLSHSGLLILGMLAGKEAVGYFSASDKLVRAISMIFSPIMQAIFPQVGQRFSKSFNIGYEFVRKILMFLMIPFVLACGGLALFANPIFVVLYGSAYLPYSTILSIQSVWMFFGLLNNLLGIQILVGSGHIREYSKIFSFVTAVTILLFIAFSYKFAGHGIAVSMLIGEFTLTLSLINQVRKLINKYGHSQALLNAT